MVEMSSNGATEKGHGVTTSAKDRAAAVRLYEESNLTSEQIGAKYGVSRQTVHRWIQSAGVPLRGPRGPRNTGEVPVVEGEDRHGPFGRILDEIDSLRRDLAELHGSADANWAHQQRQLYALTSTLDQLVGAQREHNASVQELLREIRAAVARSDTTK